MIESRGLVGLWWLLFLRIVVVGEHEQRGQLVTGKRQDVKYPSSLSLSLSLGLFCFTNMEDPLVLLCIFFRQTTERS